MIYLAVYLFIGLFVGAYIIMGHLEEYGHITAKQAGMHMLLGLTAGPLLAVMYIIDQYILPKKK